MRGRTNLLIERATERRANAVSLRVLAMHVTDGNRSSSNGVLDVCGRIARQKVGIRSGQSSAGAKNTNLSGSAHINRDDAMAAPHVLISVDHEPLASANAGQDQSVGSGLAPPPTEVLCVMLDVLLDQLAAYAGDDVTEQALIASQGTDTCMPAQAEAEEQQCFHDAHAQSLRGDVRSQVTVARFSS